VVYVVLALRQTEVGLMGQPRSSTAFSAGESVRAACLYCGFAHTEHLRRSMSNPVVFYCRDLAACNTRYAALGSIPVVQYGCRFCGNVSPDELVPSRIDTAVLSCADKQACNKRYAAIQVERGRSAVDTASGSRGANVHWVLGFMSWASPLVLPIWFLYGAVDLPRRLVSAIRRRIAH
jgi:hypothetical protein